MERTRYVLLLLMVMIGSFYLGSIVAGCLLLELSRQLIFHAIIAALLIIFGFISLISWNGTIRNSKC